MPSRFNRLDPGQVDMGHTDSVKVSEDGQYMTRVII